MPRFFSRCYPRHNVDVTFNFPGSFTKVFWRIIFCISDSSIVLNIFRNINSQVSGTNQVEGSEHPHKRKDICSSSWALFCWQGKLMIFLRMLREASVCCRDGLDVFFKEGSEVKHPIWKSVTMPPNTTSWGEHRCKKNVFNCMT